MLTRTSPLHPNCHETVAKPKGMSPRNERGAWHPGAGRLRRAWNDASVREFLSEWQAWHETREQVLRGPHGWLAITAIHWLTDTPQRFGDVPGAWSGDEHGATVHLAPGETLAVEDTLIIEGVHRFGPLD